MITTFSPHIYSESIDGCASVLSTTSIGMRSITKNFEEAIRNKLGISYGCAVSSCTAAMEMSLNLLGVGSINGGNASDEVITSPFTFISTNLSILRAGARVVFADIDPYTFNISPSSIMSKISSNTRAVIVTHMYGHSCDMDSINSIGVPVIEDCAHAFGTMYKNRYIGSEDNNIHCYSFQATKNITTVDGGFIGLPDKDTNERALSIRSFGKGTSLEDGTYDMLYTGGKYSFSDVYAAIGMGQLLHYDDDYRRREVMWNIYNNELGHNYNIRVPMILDYCTKHSMHAYTILCSDRMYRNTVISRLKSNCIQGMILYKPHYYYSVLTDDPLLYPVTEDVYSRCVTLPFHMNLTDDDIRLVCNTINFI